MTPPRLLLLAAVALLASGTARAQEDAGDPTRPPAVLSAPAGNQSEPGSSGGEPQLQSILVSLKPGGRRVAVIDGKTLREGGKIGGAVVESIRPTEVVLRKGNQRQVLKLFRPAARGAAV